MYWSDEESEYYTSDDYILDEYNSEDYISCDETFTSSSNDENREDYELKEININNDVYVIRIPYNNESIFIQLLDVLQYVCELNGRVHWNAGNFYCNDKRDEQFLKNFDIIPAKYLPIDPASSTLVFDKDDIIINY